MIRGRFINRKTATHRPLPILFCEFISDGRPKAPRKVDPGAAVVPLILAPTPTAVLPLGSPVLAATTAAVAGGGEGAEARVLAGAAYAGAAPVVRREHVAFSKARGWPQATCSVRSAVGARGPTMRAAGGGGVGTPAVRRTKICDGEPAESPCHDRPRSPPHPKSAFGRCFVFYRFGFAALWRGAGDTCGGCLCCDPFVFGRGELDYCGHRGDCGVEFDDDWLAAGAS